MIVILSNAPRERAAFSALCDSHGWASTECESIRSLKKLTQKSPARIVLLRHRLSDGYSDDVIALFDAAGRLPAVKLIVLLDAGTPSAVEARQVALGADLVLRDPVRTDVLVRYLARYRTPDNARRAPAKRVVAESLNFAHGRISLLERRLQRGAATTGLTPREVSLVELLAHFAGEIVTYETLYNEILGRKFRGETSNMRVLFAKLSDSFRAVGLALRDCVDVIPKTGYRYRSPGRTAARPAAPTSHPKRPSVTAWSARVVASRGNRDRPTAA